MSDFHLAVEMTFTTDRPSTDEEFDSFLDEVMTQLANIGSHPSLAARLRDRVADFAVEIDADDFTSAAKVFLSELRTALHAADCITESWPQFFPTEHVVRELMDA